MRIVQLITQDRGGPVDHAVGVAGAFAALGHDSHVVGPPGAYTAQLADEGVVWHRAAIGSKWDAAGAGRVVRTVRRLAPDVLHCQDRRAGLVGRLVSRALGLPTVYTLHGVPDALAARVPGNLPAAPERWFHGAVYLRGEQWLARMGDAHGGLVVTPCAALARYAEEQVGIRRPRIRVVPNGVPEDWARPGRVVTDDLGDEVTAVWLGVMQPVKRLTALVTAVAGVPGLRLRLVGDGPQRALVEQTARDLGCLDRVELTGFVDDPRALLAESDLFVLPSAAEACPLALLQAMALGLPVVASAAGGIPEVVRHDVDGLLVPTGDDDSLAAALQRLRSDPALRRRLGRSARTRARDEFTVTRSAEGLLAAYREVGRCAS